MSKFTLKRADGSMPNLFSSETDEKQVAAPELVPDAPLTPLPPVRTDFVNELNPVQREAVTTVDGPVLIVAGAGSGKTRVLTYRIAYLLSVGIKPWNILALTFTNKAAAEMKERISHLVGAERAKPLWMGTFHSVFSRILRREAEALGYTSSFTIYDTDDSLGVVRAAMSQFGISSQEFSPKMILNRISAAKNAMISTHAFHTKAGNSLEEKIAHVYESYEKRLRGNNAMDFDDLLTKTIELFERSPDVLKKYQEQFHHILIDEYQDTNRAQYLAVKMLASATRNICVVGDDAQSIYRFRGADIKNILDFERDYTDYKVFRLEQNYRSTQHILAAADDVIKNNRRQIPKTLWTENPEGDKIAVITLRDEREEGEEVVKTVQREVREGKTLNDIAILYRTNSQSLSIEDGLRRANIPYGIVGGVAFYRRKEVKDALAYLRLIVNERDDESFSRAINTPARGVGEVTMKRLRHYATENSLSMLEASMHPERIPDFTPRAGNALHTFAEMIARAKAQLNEVPTPELARQLLSDAGVLQSYKDEGTPEAIARWDNVQRILSHIAEYSDNNPGATLDQYLQEISLLSEADNYDTSAERITLMTIHSAKGLEFRTVIVTGMEEGLFPVGNSAHEQDDLEEERRLFYVAVTRAKERLLLMNCERRYRFGELSYPTASRFLAEIRDEHMEFNSVASSTPKTANFGSTSSLGSNYGGGGSSYGNTRSTRPGRTYRDTPAQTGDEFPPDDYSQTEKTLSAGSNVYHAVFGRGKVEMVTGTGDKTKVTIRFDKAGRKQLMLKFANLRLL